MFKFLINAIYSQVLNFQMCNVIIALCLNLLDILRVLHLQYNSTLT